MSVRIGLVGAGGIAPEHAQACACSGAMPPAPTRPMRTLMAFLFVGGQSDAREPTARGTRERAQQDVVGADHRGGQSGGAEIDTWPTRRLVEGMIAADAGLYEAIAACTDAITAAADGDLR